MHCFENVNLILGADCMINEETNTTGCREKENLFAQLQGIRKFSPKLNCSEDLGNLEQEVFGWSNRIGEMILQENLQAILDSDEHQKKEKQLIKDWPAKMKSEGYVTVSIRTAGGSCICLRVRYYRRVCDRRNGKRHKGVYAGLILLGIHDRCTPQLAAMISAWSALLSSFDEVRQVLLEQGIVLDVKVIRKIAYRYAERSRIMQQAGHIPISDEDKLQGKKVVVSMDGGRTRLRENKRGPKTKKDRTRYKASWREPKLFIVYVVNEDGKLEKSFSPFIDGCIKGPDAIFKMLKAYLSSLSIQDADRILFIADGARWIWNRISGLVKQLGLNLAQVHELIDFYHAVEHLGKVAALRKKWSTKERKSWIAKQRRRFLKGESDLVVKAVQDICRGRNGKAIATERDYFIRNAKRLAYPEAKALNLPIGSGAVESAIRRVINLRLKGPCIFWYKTNAEKILLLRSYYKSGRWSCLKKMANSYLSYILI